MDDILLKRKVMFFNNLVLLGLDRMTFEKKHGIPFHKNMFVLPNKKGYDVVTHFLFSNLSAVTGKDYNLPWPLLSKELDRMFQKTSYTHLTNFSQENEVKFPRIVPSLLSTFGGDRFYEVYLAFSCYVLNKTIRKNGNINLLSRPSITRESFSTAKDILQLSTILSMQKFRHIQNVTHINHCIWSKFTKNLSECLRKLKLLLKTNEDLLKSSENAISSLYVTVPEETCSFKKITAKSFEALEQIKRQRKKLEQFFCTESKLWKYLASEVGENVQNEVLNGQHFNIDATTDNLPQECCTELQKVGVTSSQEDGKLSVMRFNNLLMAYIKCITELLKKADLSNLHEDCFVNNASSIGDDLSSINSLNKKLSEEIIPNLEESIQKLKLTSCFEDLTGKFESSCSQFCSSLPVLHYNPEAVKERASHIPSDTEEMFQLPTLEIKMSSAMHSDLSCVPKELLEVNTSHVNLVNDNISNHDSTTIRTDASARRFTKANSCIPRLVKGKENCLEASCLRKNDVFFKDNPSSSELNISALDGIDFAPSTHFKMRESWLHEESINGMTLPDVSFDE